LFSFILFSASLELIISLILFITHLILFLYLNSFNFCLPFISALFFVNLQFESFQTERKTENSFMTYCHIRLVSFHQKWLLLYAVGRGSSLVNFRKVEPTTFHPARAVVLLGSILSLCVSIYKDRVRDHPGARAGYARWGGGAPPHPLLLYLTSNWLKSFTSAGQK
jgi:hypothetical protein